MIEGLLNPLIQPVQDQLNRATERQRVIASNVANVDTPGYHARHLGFGDELDQATVRLKTDGPRHFDRPGAGSLEVDDRPRRVDGNSVDLEREMADMRKNALLYATLTSALRNRLQGLRAAILEGRQ